MNTPRRGLRRFRIRLSGRRRPSQLRRVNGRRPLLHRACTSGTFQLPRSHTVTSSLRLPPLHSRINSSRQTRMRRLLPLRRQSLLSRGMPLSLRLSRPLGHSHSRHTPNLRPIPHLWRPGLDMSRHNLKVNLSNLRLNRIRSLPHLLRNASPLPLLLITRRRFTLINHQPTRRQLTRPTRSRHLLLPDPPNTLRTRRRRRHQHLTPLHPFRRLRSKRQLLRRSNCPISHQHPRSLRSSSTTRHPLNKVIKRKRCSYPSTRS